MQRKHAWTPTDLERFTELYRSDHANEQAEATAQEQLASAEKTAEEAAAQLSRSILARYHEEQIWSDKIRRMSTWGTWGLMGVNVLLFLLFQVAVEPWRRRRLVKGFEEKVLEALQKEEPQNKQTMKGGLAGAGVAVEGSYVADNIADTIGPTTEMGILTSNSSPRKTTTEGRNEMAFLDVPFEATAHSPMLTATTFEHIKAKAQDLFSDRPISLRQLDLTTAALEGAAAGMVIAWLAVTLVRFR